jgi:hypothetical protein
MGSSPSVMTHTSSASTSSFTTATTFSTRSSLYLLVGVRSASSARSGDPTPLPCRAPPPPPPPCGASAAAMARRGAPMTTAIWRSCQSTGAMASLIASSSSSSMPSSIAAPAGRMRTAQRRRWRWREARAVGGSEIHGNPRQLKLHLLSPHILFAWSIWMFSWRRMHVATEVLWLGFCI